MYVYQTTNVMTIDADQWAAYWETEIQRSYAAFDDGHMHGSLGLSIRWADNDDYTSGWHIGNVERIELEKMANINLTEIRDLNLDMSDWNIDRYNVVRQPTTTEIRRDNAETDRIESAYRKHVGPLPT